MYFGLMSGLASSTVLLVMRVAAPVSRLRAHISAWASLPCCQTMVFPSMDGTVSSTPSSVSRTTVHAPEAACAGGMAATTKSNAMNKAKNGIRNTDRTGALPTMSTPRFRPPTRPELSIARYHLHLTRS